ncbi:MAG TPA: hypothetical protein VK606_11845, partial [Verrucomicrobiae bacterium]|nr:hypothetical protein [Verrucomicrobiae bacterium]
GYAFIDAANCGGSSNVSTTVSTTEAGCKVFFDTISGYDNWGAFAAAHPTYRIAQGHFPFIIADEPGHYAVSSIVLT